MSCCSEKYMDPGKSSPKSTYSMSLGTSTLVRSLKTGENPVADLGISIAFWNLSVESRDKLNEQTFLERACCWHALQRK